MDRQREAKRAYKESPPPAGVFQIRNLRNDKRLIGSWFNVRGRINRERFLLEAGKHDSAELQKDWNELGAEVFAFEVLDELKPAEGETAVKSDELRELEALWLEKLQPFGARGYNRKTGK